MTTMLIAFNGTLDNGQFLGDQLCSIKAAWLFAQNYPCDKYLLALSPSNQLNFLWQKLIDSFKMEVIYDTFQPGNIPDRFAHWTTWRKERNIEGRPFDIYKELYRRIDGCHRQQQLCGEEKGLRRKNIFEYFWFGQEESKDAPENIEKFDGTLIYHLVYPADRQVFLAPYAKCQGNFVFTFDFWEGVVHRLLDNGISVTVNHNGMFGEQFSGNPLYRKIYPPFKELVEEICRHKIVACGNTGIGWLAAACDLPLLAMQPPNSNMPDYRYEQCGVKSLVDIIDTPDPDFLAKRLVEEVNRVTVFTTGCYDVLHAGHIRHLEESRSLGTRLVVGLNSDSSIKRLKGENRPVNTQQQRTEVLQAIRYVDEVRIFDDDDALEMIRDIKPDIITNGCDHKIADIVGKAFVEQYGGRAVITGGTRDQSTTKIIHAVIKRTAILKAIQDGGSVSVNPFAKLELLANQFVAVSSLFGDIADVGVYRGGTGLILRRLAPNKDLHLFDTWAGTPFNDELCHHKKGEWLADINECRRIVGENERTHYWQGVFPYSTEDGDRKCQPKDRKFCFAYIDPDTYQTVRDSIEFFWPRLVQGGKLFFDDYAWAACAGVEKAVNEKFTKNERMVFPALHTCIVVKK